MVYFWYRLKIFYLLLVTDHSHQAFRTKLVQWLLHRKLEKHAKVMLCIISYLRWHDVGDNLSSHKRHVMLKWFCCFYIGNGAMQRI